VLVAWLERALRDDIHSNAQEFLKVLEQPDVIKQRCARLEVDKQIQIAIRASLAAGDGAEHGDPVCTTFPRDTQDLRAALSQPFQRQHLFSHRSRVAPGTYAELEQRRSFARNRLAPIS
jgi:hypothetical protein